MRILSSPNTSFESFDLSSSLDVETEENIQSQESDSSILSSNHNTLSIESYDPTRSPISSPFSSMPSSPNSHINSEINDAPIFNEQVTDDEIPSDEEVIMMPLPEDLLEATQSTEKKNSKRKFSVIEKDSEFPNAKRTSFLEPRALIFGPYNPEPKKVQEYPAPFNDRMTRDVENEGDYPKPLINESSQDVEPIQITLPKPDQSTFSHEKSQPKETVTTKEKENTDKWERVDLDSISFDFSIEPEKKS